MAARAGHLQSPASPSPALDAEQGWTEEQKAALQRAFLTVKPNQPKFWLHVSKLVPGKTALQCCNAKFDEMPTPVEKPKPRGKGQGGSPIQAPALKLAAGKSCMGRLHLLCLSSLPLLHGAQEVDHIGQTVFMWADGAAAVS